MHKKPSTFPELATGVKVPPLGTLGSSSRLSRSLRVAADDMSTGRRTRLYRFIADTVPVVAACIWTWARLTAAPGRFRPDDRGNSRTDARVQQRLDDLLERLHTPGNPADSGGVDLLTELTAGLFRDGMFGGIVTVDSGATRVERFRPLDAARFVLDNESSNRIMKYEADPGNVRLDRPDFYFMPLGGGIEAPLGRSILSAVPFVSFVEQQLVDDMRRSSHNAGFHRLHVRITPPERLSAESDSAYVERINSYFDATVGMIRSCEVDDNPVTWDNVAIEYIGPENSRSVTNSWFFNHRAMIEEICAGTNLAPFMLGYSYGATTTWSSFKFDLVMRQVRSVQTEIARFMEWLGAIDLALGGFEPRCRWEFDNTFAYQASDRASVQTQQVNNVIRLFEAGLLDKQTAIDKAGCLI